MVQLSVDKLNENTKISRWIQIVIALVGALLMYVSGKEMLELPLWGHRPLTFFFGAWLLCNAIFSFIKKKTQNRFYFLLSAMSGFMLHLSFPESSMTPLIFFAFIPILFIVENEVKQEKGGLMRVFRYSYSAFLLWNILTTYWVANTAFIPSIVAFTLNAFFMTIPIMMYYVGRKRLKIKYALPMFISFWLAFEFIHLRWEISWPWLTLGNAFASRSLWIQWYQFTGHLGGSLWVLLANYSIFWYIQKIRTKETMKVEQLLIPIAIISVPLFVSMFTFFGYQQKGKPINVAVVQPNFEPHYKKFTVSQKEQTKQFVKLSKKVLTDSTDYLIFPETSFGCYNTEELDYKSSIVSLVDVLKDYPNTTLVTGLCTYDLFNEKIDSLNGMRDISRDGKTRYMRTKNAAYEINHTGLQHDQEHIKGKLVPGAEIFPYNKLLFFLEPIVKKAGGSIAGHARELPKVLTSGKSQIAPAICYESVYGYWMRKFVQDGAELLFVVTNDGWWDNTPGHRQHLAYSILRAIETRRSIARSANTGISCFIDQHGRVWKPTMYDEEAVISRTMYANDDITFYVRYGDLIGRLALLLTAVFIAWMIRLRIRKLE